MLQFLAESLLLTLFSAVCSFILPAFNPAKYSCVSTRATQATLSKMRSVWKKISPATPFTYSFLDEKFDSFYKEQQRWSRIISWAGGISVLLACLGLFGLAYRISIRLWIFVATGIVALMITLITVSVQAIKVAMANPVKSLRTE